MLVPKSHDGIPYGDTLRQLSLETNVRRYIEVGVSKGHVFSQISCVHGIGVDPGFDLTQNVAANKAMTSLFQLTSDDFFAMMSPQRILGGPADLVFLDGMHLFEFLLRDFMNAEALCARESIIALHDCLPLNAAMANRDIDKAHEKNAGTPFADWWTGDVWKLIPILQRYRPDLTLVLVDAEPTGLVFVTNLDPSSQILRQNYSEIVATFTAMPNDDEAIEALYAVIAVTSAGDAGRALGNRRFTVAPPTRASPLKRASRALGWAR